MKVLRDDYFPTRHRVTNVRQNLQSTTEEAAHRTWSQEAWVGFWLLDLDNYFNLATVGWAVVTECVLKSLPALLASAYFCICISSVGTFPRDSSRKQRPQLGPQATTSKQSSSPNWNGNFKESNGSSIPICILNM